jgi:hypothetical protein
MSLNNQTTDDATYAKTINDLRSIGVMIDPGVKRADFFDSLYGAVRTWAHGRQRRKYQAQEFARRRTAQRDYYQMSLGNDRDGLSVNQFADAKADSKDAARRNSINKTDWDLLLCDFADEGLVLPDSTTMENFWSRFPAALSSFLTAERRREEVERLAPTQQDMLDASAEESMPAFI